MKLLVVDNGKCVAARLGQALRELGHEAILSPDPAQAITAARELVVDAVIVDVELPAMDGVAFAETLWLFDESIPVAFRQCSHDSALISRAAEIGLLFPARWTSADLGRLVAALARRRPRAAIPPRRLEMRRETEMEPQRAVVAAPSTAEGSGPSRDDGPGAAPGQAEEHAAGDTWLLVPMRKIVRKIKVACRTWEQVEKLCDQRDAGKDYLTLRGPLDLAPRDRLTVALHLPGALTISFAAQITSTRSEGEERAHVIHLVGFTPERCAWLRTMAASASLPAAAAAVRPGPPVDCMPPMDCPIEEPAPRPAAPGWPTRHQIDCLAEKMRPAPEQDRAAPLVPVPGGRGGRSG